MFLVYGPTDPSDNPNVMAGQELPTTPRMKKTATYSCSCTVLVKVGDRVHICITCDTSGSSPIGRPLEKHLHAILKILQDFGLPDGSFSSVTLSSHLSLCGL
jgi:hypothetical protein